MERSLDCSHVAHVLVLMSFLQACFSFLFDPHDSAMINLECSDQATVICVSESSRQLLVKTFLDHWITSSLLGVSVPSKLSRILTSLWTVGSSRSRVFLFSPETLQS